MLLDGCQGEAAEAQAVPALVLSELPELGNFGAEREHGEGGNRQQDWEQAELLLYNLSRINPDHLLYKLYAERIQEYRANPPGENWDGVTTFETK